VTTSVTISPQARIVALVGVLLIALGGSAFYVMHGHAQPQTVTTPPAQQPAQHPTPRVHIVRPTVDPLFPTPLRNALEHNAIVVVGFYNPRAPVGSATIAEAQAGAAAAHVGFLRVNLLDDAVAGPLTALLPAGQLLPNPGIVIYGRPGTLLYRSDGYLDHAAVVEAVRGSK
jgi:hypothetical protein